MLQVVFVSDAKGLICVWMLQGKGIDIIICLCVCVYAIAFKIPLPDAQMRRR